MYDIAVLVLGTTELTMFKFLNGRTVVWEHWRPLELVIAQCLEYNLIHRIFSFSYLRTQFSSPTVFPIRNF